MKKALIVLLFCLSIGFALGQSSVSYVPTSNISAYTYEGVRSGVETLKMNTYILGQVYKPGLYVVPDNIDFLTLLALAGGPKEDAKLSKIRIIRPTADGGERIIWVNFKRYMETGDEALIPRIMPGDTIILSGTIFYAFSKVADFLSKVAIALSVYNLISNIK